MSWQTTINLQPHFFEKTESTLAEFGGLIAHTFQYRSGVCGLQLTNGVGRMILLPYKGQQIWWLELNGREITIS